MDDVGYYVECPVCSTRCRSDGPIGELTLEDDVTKGATLVYALHFERFHDRKSTL